MKHHLTATSALIALGVSCAAPATAATAYLNGVMGVGPGYSTIIGPDGQRCTHDCVKLRYDNVTDDSAAAAIDRFLAEHGSSGNTIWAFSLSTNGVLKYLAEHPDDRNTWILLGSPSAPDSGNPMALPIPETAADVTFVTRERDSVAQHAQPRADFGTHISGYRNLDLRREPTGRESVSETVETVTYDDAAKLDWRERAEQRRADWKAKVEARREARAQRIAESKARWQAAVDKWLGRDTDPDAGRAAPVDDDEASPSGSVSAAERPASATASDNAEGGDQE